VREDSAAVVAETSCVDAVADIRGRVDECLKRVAAYGDPAVWITLLSPDQIDEQVERAISQGGGGRVTPLLGATVAVKDNIDVAGVPTTAGCPDFAYTPARSAMVGACRNVYDERYISGGSSSGSAVAVAAGLVDFSLGTDTAGSGRVPAAFNNIVGLKPTKGLISTRGVVPACRSLDCVSIFARNIDVAQRAFHAAQGFDPEDIYSRRSCDLSSPTLPGNTFRFGVPAAEDLLFFGNEEVRRLYDRARKTMIAMGGSEAVIDYTAFRETADLLYDGPWVAERLAAVKELFGRSPGSMLLVIRQIIGGAAKFSAVDAFEAQYRLLACRHRAEAELKKVDVLLLPTAGTIYTIAEVEAEPITLNRNLGYYTNFVNLLDLCALAVPAGFQSNGLPAGVTFVGPAGADDALADLGRRFLAESSTRSMTS
jgi:allophanate hydrolase